MDRFGRPRFRGAAAPKPYARPTSQGNNFGSPSMRQSGGQQQDSYQNKSKEWQPSQSPMSGSLLGVPSKRFGGNDSARASGGNHSLQQNNPPVPNEVRKLMHNLGLSQGDIQKLSKLPENELSASNLARIIGGLRQEKNNDGRRSQSFDSSTSGPNRSGSFRREERGAFGGDGILGEHPEQSIRYPTPRPDERRFDKHSEQDRPFFDSDNRRKNSDRFSEQQYDRDEFMDPKPGPRFGDRRQFSRSDRDDDYYDDAPSYRRDGSGDRFDQPHDDSFEQNNRRFNNKNINQREEESRQGYGGERRMERGRQEPRGRGRGPRGTLSRPAGMRNPSRSSIPPLMGESPRREEGRMGNSNRSGAQGLGDLVAAVGGGSVGQAASLLTPLMLATQTDPSVLEAQIQAMKALQAQAIKMKEQDSYNRPGRDQRRGRSPPRRRSPPLRSRGGVVDRRLEEEARKEAQIMRSARGRVLYIKFKSPRIVENDLRQMASAFGKVTKLLLIKPKIPNGHFQVFLEMGQWEGAAAMLEHYMAKAPNIKGCPVDVKRSNYVDLKLRSEQARGNKRVRSMSPVRKGTTQLSHKRDRMDSTPKLSITTSKSDRRIVTRSNSAEKNKDEPVPKGDAREILNRTRSEQEKKDGEKKIRARTRWGSPTSADKKNDEDKNDDLSKEKGDNNDKAAGKDGEVDQGASGSIKEKTDLSETDAPKEDLGTLYDPLDAIADELALNDEFTLMEEADKKGERSKEEVGDKSEDADEEEKKEAEADLEKNDFDLNDVNVDEHPDNPDGDNQPMETVDEEDNNKDSHKNQSNGDFEEIASSVYIVKEETDEEDANDGKQEKLADDEPQNDRYLTVEELSDQQEKELNKTNETKDERTDSTALNESEPANVSTGLMDAIDEFLENSDDDRPYLQADQLETEESYRMDKIEHFLTLMEDSLKEVQNARNHLEALTKVTKAKAALALAKKIDVCLDIASGFLKNPESPPEE